MIVELSAPTTQESCHALLESNDRLEVECVTGVAWREYWFPWRCWPGFRLRGLEALAPRPHRGRQSTGGRPRDNSHRPRLTGRSRHPSTGFRYSVHIFPAQQIPRNPPTGRATSTLD